MQCQFITMQLIYINYIQENHIMIQQQNKFKLMKII